MANKQEAITAVQGILGYTFKDPELLWLALQAAGSGVGPMDGNKKLAMMGDTVMKLIILDDLYTDGTQRGPISTAVDSIVSNQNLAAVCITSGLNPHINKNPTQYGETPPKTRAATVEAVLAAAYRDSNREMAVVRRVMVALGLASPTQTPTETSAQAPTESG